MHPFFNEIRKPFYYIQCVDDLIVFPKERVALLPNVPRWTLISVQLQLADHLLPHFGVSVRVHGKSVVSLRMLPSGDPRSQEELFEVGVEEAGH